MDNLTLKLMMGAASSADVFFTRSTMAQVTSGSGTLSMPTGAVGMRVAAVGAGGKGGTYPSVDENGNPITVNRGGRGGNCAATNIVDADDITYSIGADGISYGGSTTASWTGYTLTATGGNGGNGDVSPDTLGGGDFTFSGGSTPGAWFEGSAGGGAAGPAGNGGSGSGSFYGSQAPELGGPGGNSFTSGWGGGGGRGGKQYVYSNRGGITGGGGTNAPSGDCESGFFGGSAYAGLKTATTLLYGQASLSVIGTPSGYIGSAGGTLGGGGATLTNSSVRTGGDGGLIVEYFYYG